MTPDEELYAQWQGAVRAIANGLARRYRRSAEDVAGELWVWVVDNRKKAAKWGPISRLTRALYSHGQAVIRKETRAQLRIYSDGEMGALLGVVLDDKQRGKVIDTYKGVIERVEAAYKGLGEADRTVLALRHKEGLRHHQSAEALEVSTTAAYERYQKAMDRLQERFESSEDDEYVGTKNMGPHFERAPETTPRRPRMD